MGYDLDSWNAGLFCKKTYQTRDGENPFRKGKYVGGDNDEMNYKTNKANPNRGNDRAVARYREHDRNRNFDCDDVRRYEDKSNYTYHGDCRLMNPSESKKIEQKKCFNAEGNSIVMEDLSDDPNKDVRYLLDYKCAWAFWVQTLVKDKDFSESLLKCETIKTPIRYHEIFALIKPPSELETLSDYMLFRDGITPLWEDPRNVDGGRWTLCFTHKTNVDKLWTEVIGLIMNEKFTEYCMDHIYGVVFTKRRQFVRLAVWMKDASNEKAKYAIGKKLNNLCKNETTDFSFINNKYNLKKMYEKLERH